MTWKTLLDASGKIISILSFTVLILSVVHDWGFYWIIGIRFQSVQTVYDYLANSIDWLPSGLATLGGAILFSFGATRLLNRLMGERPEYPTGVGEKKMRERKKQIRIWLPAIILVAAPLVMFLALPIGEQANLVLGGGAILTLLLGLIPIFFEVDKKTDVVLANMMGAAMLITFTFAFGALQAERSLKSNDNVYRVETRGGAITVNLLRSLEKGVLVWENANQRTVFLKWDQIDRISHFVSLVEKPSLICTYFRILCDPPPPIP